MTDTKDTAPAERLQVASMIWQLVPPNKRLNDEVTGQVAAILAAFDAARASPVAPVAEHLVLRFQIALTQCGFNDDDHEVNEARHALLAALAPTSTARTEATKAEAVGMVDRKLVNRTFNALLEGGAMPDESLELLKSLVATPPSADSVRLRDALRELVEANDDEKDEQRERWYDAMSTARALIAAQPTSTECSRDDHITGPARILPTSTESAEPQFEDDTRCDVPPAGWFCTRSHGHEGACAAWPASPPREAPADDAPVPWNDPTTANFVNALKITEGVLDAYRESNPKWWKRMDGTPILNGMAVFMAHALVKAVRADRQSRPIDSSEKRDAIPDGLLLDLLIAAREACEYGPGGRYLERLRQAGNLYHGSLSVEGQRAVNGIAATKRGRDE